MLNNKYIITFFASSTNEGEDLVNKIDCDAFRAFVDTQLVAEGLIDMKSVVNVIYPSDSAHNTLNFYKIQKQSDIVMFDAPSSVKGMQH